jgi:hypothetical protein
MQENLKKMLEKAETLGRHGVSTKTIKLFFNASTDLRLILAFFCYVAGEPEEDAWKIKSSADLRLSLAFFCYDAGEPEEDA